MIFKESFKRKYDEFPWLKKQISRYSLELGLSVFILCFLLEYSLRNMIPWTLMDSISYWVLVCSALIMPIYCYSDDYDPEAKSVVRLFLILLLIGFVCFICGTIQKFNALG